MKINYLSGVFLVVSVDTFAFYLLSFLFSVLGIKDIPSEVNPKWNIEKRWEERGDQTYQLIMTSRSLGEECQRVGSGFVVFPQTYMGQMQIFVDGQLVYTNSMSHQWNLTQLMSKPLISCDLFRKSSVTSLEINAYMKFFASVSGYPQVVKKFPQQYIFYEEMFVISGVAALFLGIIGSILISKISTVSDTILYCIQQIAFCVFVLSHVPGRLVDVSLALPHIAVVISGFFGLTCLALSTFNVKLSKLGVLAVSSLVFLSPGFLFYGYRNATHLYVLLLIISAGISSIVMFIYKAKKIKEEKNYLIVFLYFILMFLVIFDGAGSQIYRNSFFHLSGIALAATMISFLHVLSGFNKQRDQLIGAKIRLAAETKTIQSITDLYSKYREIIHDVKSPIMSLMFLLPDAEKNKDILNKVGSRVKDILGRIEDDQINKITDWYSIETLLLKLHQIIEEKMAVHKNFDVEVVDFRCANKNILLNPIDFEIIVEELIDNAVKYSDGMMKVVFENENNFIVVYLTSNKSMEKSDDSKGYLRKIGQGIGLQNIKKKMSEMSGVLEVSETDTIFTVKISFLQKV